MCVERSKLLADGGDWGRLNLEPLIKRLRRVVEASRSVTEMRRDRDAHAMWCEVYSHLVRDRDGLFGALTSRAAPHVLRLSCIHALLDLSDTIRGHHLEAALALWKYCEDSTRLIFSTTTSNQVADQILKALRASPQGLSRSDLRNLFGRHRSSGEIGVALQILAEADQVECREEETGGRSTERWFAVSETARKA